MTYMSHLSNIDKLEEQCWMNAKKLTYVLGIFLALAIILSACTGKTNWANSTFPNIDDSGIPDVLEITVGTLGNTYFSSGITDNSDYKSALSVTFEDTAEADYTTLIEHYQTTSTGKDKDDSLLFDWGRLQVTTGDDSIFLIAYIK